SIEGAPVTTGALAWSIARSSPLRPSASTLTVRSRSVTIPAGSPLRTSTTDPTLRSRISAATSRTGVAGSAVTTDAVISSRISIAPEDRPPPAARHPPRGGRGSHALACARNGDGGHPPGRGARAPADDRRRGARGGLHACRRARGPRRIEHAEQPAGGAARLPPAPDRAVRQRRLLGARGAARRGRARLPLPRRARAQPG